MNEWTCKLLLSPIETLTAQSHYTTWLKNSPLDNMSRKILLQPFIQFAKR